MRAAIFKGPGSIEIGERPDPRVEEPTDAVVRVVMACVCGSDLWYYRGESEPAVGSIGQLLPFIGYPRALNALRVIDENAPFLPAGEAPASDNPKKTAT